MIINNYQSLQSAALRKLKSSFLQVPRIIRKINNKDDYTKNPPILVNSLPKSGTHYLIHFAHALPKKYDYGNFISNRLSYSRKIRTQYDLTKRIKLITPGEIVRAHIPFSLECANCIERTNIFHLFIYRDPRAVVISEIEYLLEMAPWNALHKRFASLNNINARIDLAIYGDGTNELPHISKRYGQFYSWIEDNRTFKVRFENLIANKKQIPEINKLLNEYEQFSGSYLSENEKSFVRAELLNSRSHTLSNKDPNRWKAIMSKRQILEIKKCFDHLF